MTGTVLVNNSLIALLVVAQWLERWCANLDPGSLAQVSLVIESKAAANHHLLVAQWLERWYANLAAQVRSWRSRFSNLITRN